MRLSPRPRSGPERARSRTHATRFHTEKRSTGSAIAAGLERNSSTSSRGLKSSAFYVELPGCAPCSVTTSWPRSRTARAAPLSRENWRQAVTALAVMIREWWLADQGRSAVVGGRPDQRAALRRLNGEPVRVCAGVPPVASRLAPELRECGSYSAKYGPPIAFDLGKRESVVGSARTASAGCAVSWGNVALRVSGQGLCVRSGRPQRSSTMKQPVRKARRT